MTTVESSYIKPYVRIHRMFPFNWCVYESLRAHSVGFAVSIHAFVEKSDSCVISPNLLG